MQLGGVSATLPPTCSLPSSFDILPILPSCPSHLRQAATSHFLLPALTSSHNCLFPPLPKIQHPGNVFNHTTTWGQHGNKRGTCEFASNKESGRSGRGHPRPPHPTLRPCPRHQRGAEKAEGSKKNSRPAPNNLLIPLLPTAGLRCLPTSRPASSKWTTIPTLQRVSCQTVQACERGARGISLDSRLKVGSVRPSIQSTKAVRRCAPPSEMVFL